MDQLKHTRILAIHDISCVGRCSLTTALPIVSAAGIECSVLPTAVLSTHTGGFKGYTYRDLTEDISPIVNHWESLGIGFDAFYTGFLGSFEQIDLVADLFDRVRRENARIYVDPVMADAGKLYAVFGPEFPKGMRKLCDKADLIMPNLTELCLMLGIEWQDGPYTREYIDGMLDKGKEFGVKRIVITGVSFEKGKVGAVYRDFVTGETGEVMRDEVPGYFHGTGDVFGSALVGACERGLPLSKAVECAVELTVSSIRSTVGLAEDVRFGVNFEPNLKNYIAMIDGARKGLEIAPVADDEGLRIISSMALSVWKDTFTGIISDSQILYMLERFQSFEALKRQTSEEDYTYLLVTDDGEPIGYCGYRLDDRGVFLSKIYILKGFHGRHISTRIVDLLKGIAKDSGRDIIHLTVNRNNTHAVDVYRHLGFETVGTADTDIGGGYEMNDYLMELKVQ